MEYLTSQDLLENESFRQWVLEPDVVNDVFWEGYVSGHPEKAGIIEEARILLLSVKASVQNSATAVDTEEMWEHILHNIQHAANVPHTVRPLRQKSVRKLWRALAAVFIPVIALSTWYAVRQKTSSIPVTISYETLVAAAKMNTLKEQINHSSLPQFIVLPDNSKITLQPGSRVSYPDSFGSERRVFLEGEAFFDVTKHRHVPFVVYAGRMVTRVLGTSFRIKSIGASNEMEIAVATGCVAVSAFRSAEEAFNDRQPGLVLLANQRATLSGNNNDWSKALVEKPLPVSDTVRTANETIYTDQPVAGIFNDLKREYGINILYDIDILKNCRVNTVFSDEGFFERLDVLCKTINASYEVVDAQVIIKSSGCH